MSALTRTLKDLATDINAELSLCESSYRASLDHAMRVGALLSEAKDQVPHGDWLAWLSQHTPISERTAQRYMQLFANPTLVSDLGIKDALAQVSTPAPKPASTDLRSALSDVKRSDAEAALAELGDMPASDSFPSSAMQRTTWRQIRDCLGRVARSMDEASADGLSGWSRNEALCEASRHAREAASLLTALGDTLAS